MVLIGTACPQEWRDVRDALRTSAGLTTIWRALNQLDLTVKKNGLRRRTTPARRRRGAAPVA